LRSLQREDQQYILKQLAGLASLAAAVSLQTRQSPLEALHGACSINPADSHLLLLKGTGDLDRLRVKDIAALEFPLNNTAPEPADEVIHIVSSFHISGYINVIGTLWPAQGEACHSMAADFYCTLSKTDDVAISYHSVVVKLMEEKPSPPVLGTIHSLWDLAGTKPIHCLQ